MTAIDTLATLACIVDNPEFDASDPACIQDLVQYINVQCRSVIGSRNTGSLNTGYRNTGSFNTGSRNTGNSNTGHSNTGHSNTGHRNTGHRNTGRFNTGNSNTGYFNTGNSNTGHSNTGDSNTGHANTGSRNTGDYNTGNRNAGFFCTQTPNPTFFDQPWNGTWDEAFGLVPGIDLPRPTVWVEAEDMSEEEKAANPTYKTTGGYLKRDLRPLTQTFPEAWSKMSEEEKQKWLNLPNFDAEKFLQITGVDVRSLFEVPAGEATPGRPRLRRLLHSRE